MAIVVAPVCRFESLMGTICGSVEVRRHHVGMYMAILRVIHSLWGRCGMMYEIAGQNRDSEQKSWRDPGGILDASWGAGQRHKKACKKACKHTPQGAPNNAPVRIRREGVGEKSACKPATHTHSPKIWSPEYAMVPDQTHSRSVNDGNTRCATLYGLQSPQRSEQ